MKNFKKLLDTNFPKKEYIILLITVLSLIISCMIISEKKIFWNDELYSYYFLSDPSFTEMMAAFGDKINNTPFLYFGLGWVWDKIFGSSELSLRLFSSVGIGIACFIIWLTLRKTYDFWSTAIGTFGVFCTSEIILSQNAEARMYGLFLMLSALAFWQFDYLARKSEITRWDIIFTVLIHAAIIHTHLFGLFYSGAILVAFVIRDQLLHKLQPKIYLSIIGSWFSFLLYIPAFLLQADAGKPRTWLPTPTLQDFIEFMSLSSSSLLRTIVVTLIILISGWQVLTLSLATDHPPIFQPSVSSKKSEASLLIFAYIFLGVPIFVWLFSLTIKPIFWDRYMIPSIISWSILLAYLSSRFLNPSVLVNNLSPVWIQRFLNTQKSLILSILLIIFLLHPITYAKNYKGRAIPGTYDTTYGYEELPIVVQPSAQFLERRHYAKNWQRYYFILDWEAAIHPGSGLFSPQEYKHLDAINRHYPQLFEGHILKTEDFLKKYDRFLVLDYANYEEDCPTQVFGLDKARNWEDMHCPKWVKLRLLNNPNYQVIHLGDIWGEALLLVEKQ